MHMSKLDNRHTVNQGRYLMVHAHHSQAAQCIARNPQSDTNTVSMLSVQQGHIVKPNSCWSPALVAHQIRHTAIIPKQKEACWVQYKQCLATLTSSVLRGHTVEPDSRRSAWRAHLCQSGAAGSPSTGGRPRPSSPYITCRAKKESNAARLKDRHAAWL